MNRPVATQFWHGHGFHVGVFETHLFVHDIKTQWTLAGDGWVRQAVLLTQFSSWLMPALAGWRVGLAEGFEFKIIVAFCGGLGPASSKKILQPSPRLAEAKRSLSSEEMVLL